MFAGLGFRGLGCNGFGFNGVGLKGLGFKRSEDLGLRFKRLGSKG